MNLGQHILVFGVRLYRWVISPAKLFVFGSLSRCRFHPTCSAYALEAITRHGACRGTMLAIKRVCRCQPWGGCGEDPVPPSTKSGELCLHQGRFDSPKHQLPVSAGREGCCVASHSCH